MDRELPRPNSYGPILGLFADQLADPALHVWSYDADTMAPALWSGVGRVPLMPFAVQGGGEACGTAIESPMQVELSFDPVKNEALKFPRYVMPAPVTRHDENGYSVTTGIGPDAGDAGCDGGHDRPARP